MCFNCTSEIQITYFQEVTSVGDNLTFADHESTLVGWNDVRCSIESISATRTPVASELVSHSTAAASTHATHHVRTASATTLPLLQCTHDTIKHRYESNVLPTEISVPSNPGFTQSRDNKQRHFCHILPAIQPTFLTPSSFLVSPYVNKYIRNNKTGFQTSII